MSIEKPAITDNTGVAMKNDSKFTMLSGTNAYGLSAVFCERTKHK